MNEVQLPFGRTEYGAELLDVAYTDHNREARYTAKFQDMGRTYKLRVTLSWNGPNYYKAYVEVLNAAMEWTHLADEPYEAWGEAMQAAQFRGPHAAAESKKILDDAATRLFVRAKRIMEA